MYSILLVEDEIVELDTLKNYVDWAGCGIDKVYTARGARSAMSIVAEHEPDIMITDIQMPKITGIELSQMIREEGYRMKIVFLTGYDKFEYARQAVQLHAEDFLLKPFQVDEVESLVRKIVGDIEKEKQVARRGQMGSGKIIEQMCLGIVDDMDRVCRIYFQKPPQNLMFQLIGLYLSDHALQAEIEQLAGVLHCVRMDKITFVILHESATPLRFFELLKESWPDCHFRGILTDRHVSASELAMTCHEMELRQDELFFCQEGYLIHLSDPVGHIVNENRFAGLEQTSLLLDAVIQGNATLAVQLLIEIFGIFEGLNRKSYCKNMYRLFLYLKDKTSVSDSHNIEEPDIFQAESAQSLRSQLIAYVRNLTRIYHEKEENHLSVFVKNYINLHYKEDCTVEEMAEAVGLSTNYLRKKFKDETGSTILECLTDYRLSLAAEQLKHSKNKVKEISVSVGYENISYFTKIFTKKYGMTPNEYRKQ